VRGLARAVEARGGIIYEQTPVTGFKAGSLITPGGELRAKRAIVLAGEAYLTRLPRLHRALLPVYSLISLDGAIERQAVVADRMAERRECCFHAQHSRISDQNSGRANPVWQPWCAPYAFGSKIRDQQDTHEGDREDDPALIGGVVSAAGRHSLHACVGWSRWECPATGCLP
jgi:hypothetical protein